jgi:hypothetical protein
MIRVGLVDLDNAHPVAYTPILQRLDDVRVTAVYDHGDVQSPEFVLRFAQGNGIERVCHSLEELVGAVDVGMLHGQNWDKHVERARPFLEAGKPVFIDKPIVGRRRDAEALLALAQRTGTPVLGGSALRFANEVAATRIERAGWGRIYSAYLCGPGDFFNFGSHFMAVVGGFFGARVEAATWLGEGDDNLFMLEQRGEARLVVQLAAGTGYPQHLCYLAMATDKGMQVVAPQGATVAEAAMRAFAQFARTHKAPVPLEGLLDDSLSLVMAAHARHTKRRVTLPELPPDAGFDGAAFTQTFARNGGYAGSGLTYARAQYAPS